MSLNGNADGDMGPRCPGGRMTEFSMRSVEILLLGDRAREVAECGWKWRTAWRDSSLFREQAIRNLTEGPGRN